MKVYVVWLKNGDTDLFTIFCGVYKSPAVGHAQMAEEDYEHLKDYVIEPYEVQE